MIFASFVFDETLINPPGACAVPYEQVRRLYEREVRESPVISEIASVTSRFRNCPVMFTVVLRSRDRRSTLRLASSSVKAAMAKSGTSCAICSTSSSARRIPFWSRSTLKVILVRAVM